MTARATTDAVHASGAVELHTTIANDVTYLLIGVVLGPLGLWVGAWQVWWVTARELDGPREGIFRMVLDFGEPGRVALSVVFLAFAWWLLCLGAGGLWRLIDRSPAIRADNGGLRFHPSLHPRPIAWPEVTGISLEMNGTEQLVVRLRQRFWSTNTHWTGHALKLYTLPLTPNVKDGVARLKQLWRANR